MTNYASKGWALFNENRIAEARAWARLEQARNPHAIAPQALIVMCDWRDGGDVGKLAQQMRAIIKKRPRAANYQTCLGLILESSGRILGAERAFRKAIEIEPDNISAIRALAELKKIVPTDPVIKQAEELHARKHLSESGRSTLGFALAKMFDDIGEHEKAFNFLAEANALHIQPESNYSESEALESLMALVDEPAKPFLGVSSSEVPVFIVGMPRSGTSLVEAVLGRHSRVHAAGETQLMQYAEKKVIDWMAVNRRHKGPLPRLIADIPSKILSDISEDILKEISISLRAPETHFTDKLPHNALRLGLIARLFPNARIIYVRRHPLDACISGYFARFSISHGYSFNLSNLGSHYRHVAEMVAAWRKLIPNPVLDVCYDLFVESPEQQSKRLVEFMGLDWDAACLRPNESNVAVFTASISQVREPVHTRSRERWKRYERWLPPLIEAMGGMDWVNAEYSRALHAGTPNST